MYSGSCSVFCCLSQHSGSKTAANLVAKQSIVGDDLKELSTSLYEVVALSVEAINSKITERFNKKIGEANMAGKKLDDLRRKHRYTIPFIFFQ